MSDRTPPPRRRIAGEAAPASPTAKKAPAKKAPAKKAPAKKAPATKAPAKKAPAKTAAKKAPAKKAPAKKAPAKTAAKKAPTKKAPAKKAPAKKAAAETTTTTPLEKAAVTAPDVAPKVSIAKPSRPARPSVEDEPKARVAPLPLLAAVLLLAAGVAAVVFGVLHFVGPSFAETREQATSTASSASEEIFTYRFDDLDQHTKDVQELMTPSFAKKYRTDVAPSLADVAPGRKVIVKAVTRNAAVLPCGDECRSDRASVLVFLDVDRQIQGEDETTVFGNRLVVDLRRDGGDWLVNDIRAL